MRALSYQWMKDVDFMMKKKKEPAKVDGIPREYVNLTIQPGCLNQAIRIIDIYLFPFLKPFFISKYLEK